MSERETPGPTINQSRGTEARNRSGSRMTMSLLFRDAWGRKWFFPLSSGNSIYRLPPPRRAPTRRHHFKRPVNVFPHLHPHLSLLYITPSCSRVRFEGLAYIWNTLHTIHLPSLGSSADIFLCQWRPDATCDFSKVKMSRNL